HLRHDVRHAQPLGALGSKLLPALGRQIVEPGAAVGSGLRPFGRDPALSLQSREPRIESAHVELNGAARYLFDAGGDGVPVLRSEDGERLKNHEVERSLQDLGAGFIWHPSIRLPNGLLVRVALWGSAAFTCIIVASNGSDPVSSRQFALPL